MAENEHGTSLPQATVTPRKKRHISVIWLVPILAALVAIGIAVQRILREGPTITIVFQAAEGIEAGKTFIKYKDVNIGQVTDVQLTEDFGHVRVTAKIAKSAAGLMVEDARFWVVEPRISLSGISGLGTLLSGNYIGFGAGTSTQSRRSFKGLEAAPVVTGNQAGRQFVLHADSLGSLGVGAPVYYRSLRAGQVVAYHLAKDGKGIDVRVFVEAPYDKFVTESTRFWNVSGINVTVGANGVDVRTQSLAALIAGGLAFETPPFAPDTQLAAPDAEFTLYADQATAMKQPEAVSARYVLYFDETLRGLSVGAPVTLFGLPGGTVTDVGLDIDPKKLRVRGRVEVVAYPERLVSRLEQGSQQQLAGEAMMRQARQRMALIRDMFEKGGLRAQLRSGSLITGQLYVAFEQYPKAPKVKIDWSRTPVELPTMPSTLPQLEDRVNSILAKVDALPFQEIAQELRASLAGFDKLMLNTDAAIRRIDAAVTPQIKSALQAFNDASTSATQLLKNTDTSVISPDSATMVDLRAALQEITKAARSLRVLTDYLDQHPEALIRGKTEEKR